MSGESNCTPEPGPRAAIEERAAEFLQRQRFWTWSDADQNEFNAWFGESPLHQAAFLRLKGNAERLEKFAALRLLSTAPPKKDGERQPPARRFLFPMLAAASFACVVAVGIEVMPRQAPPPDRTFSTNVGEQASLKFSDRTEIQLNTDTALRYRMTTAERIVWLKKGEAFFRVAHDAAHPFVVYAGGHRITDLGTEFVVRDAKDYLRVMLVKGRAQITADDKGMQIATLRPGDEAVATASDMEITKRTSAELQNELAWRRGKIVFDRTPLSQAVDEFNRYSRTKMVIVDPGISDLKIGGEFASDNVGDFLAFMQTILKVHVDHTANEIRLSSASRDARRTVHLKLRH